MTLSEEIIAKAAIGDEEHDAAHRLVSELERWGLDSLLLNETGRELVLRAKTMDNGGPRKPLIVQPAPQDRRGWVGPVPWSPKRWREHRAGLRGEG